MANRNKISQKLRMEIYMKTNGKCWYCGTEIRYSEMEVDHIVARISGGKDKKENYVPSCQPCNCTKGVLSVEDFRNKIQDYPFQDHHVSQYLKMTGQKPKKVVFFFETMKKNQGEKNGSL